MRKMNACAIDDGRLQSRGRHRHLAFVRVVAVREKFAVSPPAQNPSVARRVAGKHQRHADIEQLPALRRRPAVRVSPTGGDWRKEKHRPRPREKRRHQKVRIRRHGQNASRVLRRSARTGLDAAGSLPALHPPALQRARGESGARSDKNSCAVFEPGGGKRPPASVRWGVGEIRQLLGHKLRRLRPRRPNPRRPPVELHQRRHGENGRRPRIRRPSSARPQQFKTAGRRLNPRRPSLRRQRRQSVRVFRRNMKTVAAKVRSPDNQRPSRPVRRRCPARLRWNFPAKLRVRSRPRMAGGARLVKPPP